MLNNNEELRECQLKLQTEVKPTPLPNCFTLILGDFKGIIKRRIISSFDELPQNPNDELFL